MRVCVCDRPVHISYSQGRPGHDRALLIQNRDRVEAIVTNTPTHTHTHTHMAFHIMSVCRS